MTLIEKNFILCPFFEGDCTSRLQHIAELQNGKVLAQFDATDLFRAKEGLKDRICISGNVPLSLLQAGALDDVKSYCKRLIEVVGKGGGFILGPRAALGQAKPENVKAMIDSAREFGRYL